MPPPSIMHAKSHMYALSIWSLNLENICHSRPQWYEYMLCWRCRPFPCLSQVLLIFQVRRNKRKLAACQNNSTVTKVVDEATKPMLAVFLSNLMFALQHSIFHILPFNYRDFSYIIVHTVFFTHLFVDPLVFMYFNQHHRKRVSQALKFCLGSSSRDEVERASSLQVSQSLSALKTEKQEQGKPSVAQELC